MTASPAARQCRDELHTTAFRLHTVGLAFADPMEETARRQLTATAEHIVEQLAQETDDQQSAQTTIDLLNLLWPTGAPEQSGDPGWWRTPLGRLCARSLGRDDAESVTYSVAGAMLGLATGTIASMAHRGALDRHPEGGVLRASVLQRLSRSG